MPNLQKKDVLTTGQVAKILRVAPNTVVKLVDTGALNGWKIPGSKDRRVDSCEVRAFCSANNIPLYLTENLDVKLRQIWFLAQEEEPHLKLISQIIKLVAPDCIFKTYRPEGISFRAGQEKPDLVIINYDVEGRDRVLEVVKAVSQHVKVLVVHNENMSQTVEALCRSKGVTMMRF